MCPPFYCSDVLFRDCIDSIFMSMPVEIKTRRWEGNRFLYPRMGDKINVSILTIWGQTNPTERLISGEVSFVANCFYFSHDSFVWIHHVQCFSCASSRFSPVCEGNPVVNTPSCVRLELLPRTFLLGTFSAVLSLLSSIMPVWWTHEIMGCLWTPQYIHKADVHNSI